jgi:halocyanin-like protein
MNQRDTEYTRRGVLKAGAGAAAAGSLAAATAGSATAQSAPYGDYLSDASNFEGGTQDATGNSSITAEVGAGTSGLLFGPAAVLVEPGTTITWEWTGEGGAHNVVHEPESGDPAFRSGETVSEPGTTFEYTFENEGVFKYFCNPHKTLGMKGVIVVGESNVQGELVEFTGAVAGPTGLSVPVVGGATAFGAVSLLGIAAYNTLVDDE